MREISRYPVCARCLAKPAPLQAEYMCACCRAPFLSHFPLDEQGRCGLCRLGVTGFDEAYSFGPYDSELRELIHLFKYGKVQTLSKPLAALMARALPRERVFDVIVPMPSHWRRKWQRGFNQAGLLAGDLAHSRRLPVSRAVRRVRHTPAQAGLTSAKRRANVIGAFKAKAGRLHGKRVLLIDDVMTTGATASACARALKDAGAARVTLLTVARADRRRAAEFRSPAQGPFLESPVSGSFEDAKSGSIA